MRERAVGIRRRRRLRQERRRQPRAHQVEAVGPALGVLEAQGRQCLLDVVTRARRVERDRDLGTKRRRGIVEGRCDRLDHGALLGQRGVEGGDIGPAQALGQARAPVWVAGDALALRALLDLDAMLDVPPEAIGGDQRARLAVADADPRSRAGAARATWCARAGRGACRRGAAAASARRARRRGCRPRPASRRTIRRWSPMAVAGTSRAARECRAPCSASMLRG